MEVLKYLNPKLTLSAPETKIAEFANSVDLDEMAHFFFSFFFSFFISKPQTCTSMVHCMLFMLFFFFLEN